MANPTEWTEPTRTRGIVGEITIEANATVTPVLPLVRAYNGGAAARDLTLPIDASLDGFHMTIKNAGETNDLVLKDDASSPSTLLTLAPGDMCEVYWAATGDPIALPTYIEPTEG